MRLRSLTIAVACAAAWTGSLARVATAQGSPSAQSQERLQLLEQRIREIGDELKRFQGRLKDGQAIVTFYDSITRDMNEFRERVDIYIRSCGDRELEFEKFRRDKSPFLEDFRAAIDRCNRDRSGLNDAIVRFRIIIDGISSNLDFIRDAIKGYENNINRDENELKARQGEKSLSDKLKSFKGSVDNYIQSPRSF